LAIGIGICAIRTSLVAEENLQAFFHANRATMEFIKQNAGHWPSSWDDLRAIQPESDFNWVAAHVTFDFNADPHKIIAQSPEIFTAIEPNQPCYVIDYEVEILIDNLNSA